MTDQLREELEDRLDKAEKSGDQSRINEARKAIDHHTLECQAHTADRIKDIQRSVNEIKSDMKDMQKYYKTLDMQHTETKEGLEEVKNTIRTWKNKADGMHMLAVILRYAGVLGAGGAIGKYLLGT